MSDELHFVNVSSDDDDDDLVRGQVASDGASDDEALSSLPPAIVEERISLLGYHKLGRESPPGGGGLEGGVADTYGFWEDSGAVHMFPKTDDCTTHMPRPSDRLPGTHDVFACEAFALNAYATQLMPMSFDVWVPRGYVISFVSREPLVRCVGMAVVPVMFGEGLRQNIRLLAINTGGIPLAIRTGDPVAHMLVQRASSAVNVLIQSASATPASTP